MAGEPAFFEIGVANPGRGKAFYGALFGWDFTPGPSGGVLPGGRPGRNLGPRA
jgi:predicted enzyme related to lactoylglutathione lyase